MSVSTPILTLSCCALAVLTESSAANPARIMIRFIEVLPSLFCRSSPSRHIPKCSYAEIFVQLAEIGFELGAGEAFGHAAVLHHIVAVGHRRGEAKVLLDQEDREALLLQRTDGLADLLDDDGGEPLGRLVEQEKPRPGAQDPANRQHLLLAARQLGALAGPEPLLEIGEQFEN